MSDAPAYWAIVPSAGRGTRMGNAIPKQYLQLGRKTVLEHSLEALWSLPGLSGIVLVSGDEGVTASIRERYAGRIVLDARGGQERCHSVLNGLEVLGRHAHADDWVLVHDAARPCVRREDLGLLLDTLSGDSVGGLLAVPASDTLKRVDSANRVVQTVDRSELWHAQTPQMFRLGMLEKAIEAALAHGYEVTDEASAMEHAGYRPLVVYGHADNIKITRQEDLSLAELFLQQQGRL